MADPIKNRPRRARVWRGALIVAGSFALLVGGLVWAAWPYVMAKSAEPDAAFLEQLAALAPQGEGPNRWNEFASFMERDLGYSGRDLADDSPLRALRHPFRWDDLTTRGWGDPALNRAAAALPAAETAIAPLDELLSRGHIAPPLRRDRDPFRTSADEAAVWGSLPSMNLPLIEVARVNAGAMRAAAERCDWPAFERALRIGLRLPRTPLHAPDPEEVTTSWMLHHIAASEALHLIDEHDIPPEVCIRAMAVAAAESNHREQITAEYIATAGRLIAKDRARRWFLDSGAANLTRFDRIYRDNLPWINDGAPANGPPTWPERLANVRAVAYPSRNEIEARIDADWDRALGEESAPDGDRVASFADRFAEWSEEDEGEDQKTNWRAEFEAQFDQESLTLPFAMRHAGLTLSQLRALEISLRLECYRAMHGRWPEELTDAMTQSETLDPASGGPMAYFRLQTTGPGRGYDLLPPEGSRSAEDLFNPKPSDWRTARILNYPRAHHELAWERDLREGAWRPEDDAPR